MAVLLQVLAGVISVFLTGYSVFFAVVFCGCFRRKKKFPEAAPKTRFAVLIAARNEEKVIGNLVDSLLKQRYPRELYDVVVIPNNCRDHTAQRAREHGAKVLECTVPVKSKGEVLQFAFSRLMKEKKYDAFCVFDADNVVDPGYLEAMNRAFCSGTRIAQGYRESKNPGSSWVSGSYSIYFRMIAECVNRPRAAWGLPVFLGGTGWAVSRSCLDERGWETASIVEDCEYSLKCVLWGEEIAWVHDAITYDEQPVSFRQSFTQRRRWSSGMLQLLPRFTPQMLRGARAGKIISRLDALLSVSAPLIQVVSCVPSLLLGAAFLLDGGKTGGTAFLFCVLIPFLMNILGTTLAAGFLACIGTGYRKGLYKGILTYWLFTLSWAWISCISLFRKTSAWKEIRHTETVGSISEVLGKQPV
ncbi:MAG: glycosyltransferase family 2 protein [Hydrogeniiclostridium sp.]